MGKETMIKLPDTLQEIFDIVSTHLLTQNARSVNDEHTCMYRGENGMKCAAGILIPDDQYAREYEFTSWDKLQAEKLVPSQFCDEIRELQKIHDNLSPEDWPNRLKRFAIKYNLEFNCTIS